MAQEPTKSTPLYKIKTTGELREFLLAVMSDLRTGKVEVPVANTMQKIAAQVNESLYAELKAQAILRDDKGKKYELGERPLTDVKLIEGKKDE